MPSEKVGNVNSGYEKHDDDDHKVQVDFEKNGTWNNGTVYDFDVVLKEIGQMGKYQVILVLMAYYVAIPAGINQVASVFLSATPYYRCSLPPLDSNLFDLTDEELKNYTLPVEDGEYSQCKRYDYNLTTCVPGQDLTDTCIKPYPADDTVAEIKCDKGFWYDTTVYASTTVTEFDLVCDNSILGAVVTSIYFFGILLSSVIGGNLVDTFGRTPVMLFAQICMVGIGIGCAYSPSLWVFAFLRFGIALFLQAGYIAGFVYIVEISGERWRTPVGINQQLVFAVGYMCLSGFAYNWRGWRHLQFAISFVPLPFLVLFWFIPESPRWLLAQNKIKKGKAVSALMARRNGTELSVDVWKRSAASGAKIAAAVGNETVSPFDLFRRPKMRWITLNMMFNWFVNSLVYYGLSLNSGALAGDDYVNNTLNGLVEFPAYILLSFTMDRLGRKPLLSGCLLVGGLACLGSTTVLQFAGDSTSLINTATALSLIGKMAISGSFAIIYNYTAELFPTTARSTAVGACSMAARVGSIACTFAIYLQDIVPWLTSVIFGVLALIAGLLSLLFPETLGVPMLTNLDEAEEFYKGNLRTQSSSEEDESHDPKEEKKKAVSSF